MFDLAFTPKGQAGGVDRWDCVLQHWQPSEIYILGSSAKFNDFKTNYIQTAHELPDKPIVLITPKDGRYIQGETSLIDFEHPESCVYVFGADYLYISDSDIDGREIDFKVYIPPIGNHHFYSDQAAHITLYDRFLKRG